MTGQVSPMVIEPLKSEAPADETVQATFVIMPMESTRGFFRIVRFSFLYLGNFRNYRRLELAVPEGASLFIGKNAQGKTNLLEAFYYLSSLNSPRSEKKNLTWLIGENQGSQ